MKRVEVYMLETHEPIVHENVKNTYTKGPLYCIQCAAVVVGEPELVYKYPIVNMFRTVETYGTHGGAVIAPLKK